MYWYQVTVLKYQVVPVFFDYDYILRFPVIFVDIPLFFFRYWYSQWINCYNSSRLKLMLIFLADLLFYCYIINSYKGYQHNIPRDIDTTSQGISTKSQGISTRVLVDIPFNFVDIPCDNLLISLLTLLISLLISQWNINKIEKHFNFVHIPRDILLISLISPRILCWYPVGYCVDSSWDILLISLITIDEVVSHPSLLIFL